MLNRILQLKNISQTLKYRRSFTTIIFNINDSSRTRVYISYNSFFKILDSSKCDLFMCFVNIVKGSYFKVTIF